MKKKYYCCNCGKENEFDTNHGTMELRENTNKKTDVYIVNCKCCDTVNRVEIDRSSNE